jgi:hypothetical protein
MQCGFSSSANGSRRTILMLALILVSVAVESSFWVFRLPFFESSDENAHADYAFSLYTAGRLIRAGEGSLHTDVHPYTRYLEDVSHYKGLRYNEDGRVPLGYGSTSFFHSLDKNKPATNKRMFAGKGHHVPYVAGLYSFLFYACEAVVLAATSLVSGNSLTAMFFAMRLFCMLLMLIALFFGFCIMRELHVDRTRALFLTAAIGFLPIASWHGAYVQPDNLACAAVSVCLYLTLMLRRLGLTSARALELGIALSVVSATKFPYAVSCFFAVFLYLIPLISRVQSGRRKVLSLSCMLIPSIVIAAVSHYFSQSAQMAGNAARYEHDQLTQMFQGSWFTAFLRIGYEFSRAFWSTFGFGDISFRFWHGFCMEDAIVFGTFETTMIIHAFIVLFTLMTIALMIYRQCIVYHGLYTIAKKRSFFSAFRVLASDPVLNAYVMFIIMMLSIDAFTLGALSAARYWLPFNTAAFLCGIWYAPRLLCRHRAEQFSYMLLFLLSAFSVLSIPFSWISVQQRFYAASPSATVHYEELLKISEPKGEGVVVVHGKTLTVRGVAVDSTEGLSARGVVIVVDGHYRFRSDYGLRTDATARWLHDDALEFSGFKAMIDTSNLAFGKHMAAVFVVSHTGDKLYPTSKTFSFFVR